MKNIGISKHFKAKKKSWIPRVVTIVITYAAILYFYPTASKESLYSYTENKEWTHGILLASDTITMEPTDDVITHLRDSLDRNFIPSYRPKFLPDKTEFFENINKISNFLKEYIQDTGKFDLNERVTKNTPKQRAISEVRKILTDKYHNRVIAIPQNGQAPDSIILSENSELFKRNTSTTENIFEEIMGALNREEVSDGIEFAELRKLIVPNIEYDATSSKQRYNTTLDSLIKARTKYILPGTVLINEGDIVTSDKARLIDYYLKSMDASKIEQPSVVLSLIGQGVYILIMLAILVFYMMFYAPRVWSQNRNFIYVVSLVGIFVVISAIVNSFMPLGPYIIPIVIVPILVQVFFHARMALWAGVITAMLCAGISNLGMEYLAIEFAGIAAAVFSLRDLAKRSQLLKTSFFVGVAYIVMHVAYEWMVAGTSVGISGTIIALLGINAVLTSVCYVLMFGVERIFGFTSNVTLIELTDINNPLLRALSDECPGTFNHVMAVSNLADDAARQIGANALLTRAGAMYHDIGKLANPTYFTENQHGFNPHQNLNPLQSAQIIINHVKEGLKRAEKAGLPPVIRDFIAEHHGAGQAKYFYFTYCKQHPDEDVDTAPFTYPGPNPRSRETSILMMADAIEAASRSLKEHTEQAITDLVNKIIDGQIADGLHSDSPLSFQDISVIKRVFIHRLMTMYHTRIAYPDDPKKKKAQEDAQKAQQTSQPAMTQPQTPAKDDESTIIIDEK